jgi:hypothetical protein
MKTSSALAYVGHNANGDREKDDFYPTPENATQSFWIIKNLKEIFGSVLVVMVQCLKL